MPSYSRECKKTKEMCLDLLRHNAVVVPYVGSERQPSGYPDRIVWHSQWHGWIEFKDKAVIGTLQQKRWRELNARVPGSAVIVRFGDTWDVGKIVDAGDFELASFTGGAKELLCILKEMKSQSSASG